MFCVDPSRWTKTLNSGLFAEYGRSKVEVNKGLSHFVLVNEIFDVILLKYIRVNGRMD